MRTLIVGLSLLLLVGCDESAMLPPAKMVKLYQESCIDGRGLEADIQAWIAHGRPRCLDGVPMMYGWKGHGFACAAIDAALADAPETETKP